MKKGYTIGLLVLLLIFSASTYAANMNYLGTWSSGTNYGQGSVIAYNKAIFYSLQNSNKGKTPNAQPTWWEQVGTVGNTVTNGSGAPASTVGNIGDFYIDTTNKRIYGPKTASGWGATFVSMVGPQGATGAAGNTGPQGIQGPAGNIGPQGVVGPIGLTGVAGPKGDTGTFQSGTSAGDMLYWNGSAWIEISAPALNFESPILKFCNGKPTWQQYCIPAIGSVAIGDIGPGGGKVFYISGDGTYRMEVAPINMAAQYGCDGVLLSGAQGTAIGTGAANTRAIVDYCNDIGIASKLAMLYTLNGYSDWFIPSKDELYALWQSGLSQYGGDTMSSSQASNLSGWHQDFRTGSQYTDRGSVPMGLPIVRSF